MAFEDHSYEGDWLVDRRRHRRGVAVATAIPTKIAISLVLCPRTAPAPPAVVDDRGMPRRSDKPWSLKRPGALLRQLVDHHSLAGPALLFMLLDLEERLIDSVRWRAPEPTPTDHNCWTLV